MRKKKQKTESTITSSHQAQPLLVVKMASPLWKQNEDESSKHKSVCLDMHKLAEEQMMHSQAQLMRHLWENCSGADAFIHLENTSALWKTIRENDLYVKFLKDWKHISCSCSLSSSSLSSSSSMHSSFSSPTSSSSSSSSSSSASPYSFFSHFSSPPPFFLSCFLPFILFHH